MSIINIIIMLTLFPTVKDYSITPVYVIIEATSREITIDIYANDNNETESAKVLDITFSLSSENSQLSFGGKPTVEIVILDNDCE